MRCTVHRFARSQDASARATPSEPLQASLLQLEDEASDSNTKADLVALRCLVFETRIASQDAAGRLHDGQVVLYDLFNIASATARAQALGCATWAAGKVTGPQVASVVSSGSARFAGSGSCGSDPCKRLQVDRCAEWSALGLCRLAAGCPLRRLPMARARPAAAGRTECRWTTGGQATFMLPGNLHAGAAVRRLQRCCERRGCCLNLGTLLRTSLCA